MYAESLIEKKDKFIEYLTIKTIQLHLCKRQRLHAAEWRLYIDRQIVAYVGIRIWTWDLQFTNLTPSRVALFLNLYGDIKCRTLQMVLFQEEITGENKNGEQKIYNAPQRA